MKQVASARAEIFRRKLQKKPEYHPSMSEPKENLRRAEASLQDAEKRLTMVRKWQPLLHQAVLEYHGSVQRIKDLAAGDVPRAVDLLTRIIDALEAYLRIAPRLWRRRPRKHGRSTAHDAPRPRRSDREPAE